MGGFMKCNKCDSYMFMKNEYNAGIPIVYHECNNCGNSTKNI